MTKDDVTLKATASALYSALVHNLKFPSRADDSQTGLRIGQYLATSMTAECGWATRGM
ncbi:hypothetical protein JG687_00016250 [Phytophthora cactorum]|uniref:Uncharacterized protein n=1 Tax=Phytophthora cactorum TaxID=29920 RepID=A0A8T1TUP3_9STRA|nr:hypothetical protein JG687_00016250 [Phytophthora cactorum]